MRTARGDSWRESDANATLSMRVLSRSYIAQHASVYIIDMDALDHSAAPPPMFGVAFLEWFRAITERNWAARQARYFEGTAYAAFGSAPWQRNARWLHGLADGVIDDLERTWSVRFPPD